MFEISKEVEIDMGHRVPLHESKCKNLHGHRYTVQMAIAGPLVEAGSESGMVKDFGFMKNILMAEVHDPYDHQLCLQFSDPLAAVLVSADHLAKVKAEINDDPASGRAAAAISSAHPTFTLGIVLISRPPTAENLARLWGEVCRKRLPQGVMLTSMTVYETPTSVAIYSPRGEQ